MAAIPDIGSVMTSFPHAVDANATVADAQATMDRHGIRHLPVTDGDRIVGVVTDRDIRHSLDPSVGLPPLRKVRDIMVEEPYVVGPGEALDRVLMQLAKRRIGCVLVAEGGRLAGIFTTTDATRMLGEHLRMHDGPTSE